MKRDIVFFTVFLFIFLIISCDLFYDNSVILVSEYEYEVNVYTFYLHQGNVIELPVISFHKGLNFVANGRHSKYDHLHSLRIETREGDTLAEYQPEYLNALRAQHRKSSSQRETWTFNEKGLFLR